MKEVKANKYDDTWFQNEGQKLAVQPTLSLRDRVLHQQQQKSKYRLLYKWSASVAAVLLVGVISFSLLAPSETQGEMALMQLAPTEASSYYMDYTKALKSSNYNQVKMAYENQAD